MFLRWLECFSDEREGFELAIQPTRIFAGFLTSVLPITSTEVRRKETIRERFLSRPHGEQYSGPTQKRANNSDKTGGAAGLQRNRLFEGLAERGSALL